MNRGRFLGLITLWFGILVIVQSTLINGFDDDLGGGLGLSGGLILALAGLYGAISSDEYDKESTDIFMYLIIFGVCLYTIGTVGELAF